MKLNAVVAISNILIVLLNIILFYFLFELRTTQNIYSSCDIYYIQIGKIAKLLSKAGQLDQTNFLITSDHGYHMGQFAMPVDKRLPYET